VRFNSQSSPPGMLYHVLSPWELVLVASVDTTGIPR
jgi:hypothetical protein